MEYNKICVPLLERSQIRNKSNSVSWSRQGHIAYTLDPENDDNFISSEGNLRLTYLECIDGKNWQLAPPTFFNIASLLQSSRITNNRNNSNTNSNANSNTNSNANLSSLPFPKRKLPPTSFVSFSNTGWDLFTADDEGNVTILVTGIKSVKNNKPKDYLSATTGINENIMQVQYSRTSFNTCEVFFTEHNYNIANNIIPPIPKHNKILEIKWLNLDKSVISNIPAVRIQQDAENQVLNGCASKMGAASDDANGFYYRYNAQQYKAYGASHPLATKQACIAIRQNGQVCLYYQAEHGIEYEKVCVDLNNNETVLLDDVITNASIGFLKNGKIIIIAYYRLSKVSKIFEIEIKWNYLSIAAKMLAENPNYRAPADTKVLPEILVTKLHQLDMNNIVQGFEFNDVTLISPNFEQDSHMEILFSFENRRKMVSDPIQTIVLRYQLVVVDHQKKIHQSFKDIAAKNGVDVTQFSHSSFSCNYIQMLTINDLILKIEPIHLDQFIAFVLSSGVIRIFKRKDMSEEVNKFSKEYQEQQQQKNANSDKSSSLTNLPNHISLMLDAGYEFTKLKEQPKFVCLSPNICSYVVLPIGGNSLQSYCLTTSNVDEDYLNGKKKGLLLAKAAAISLRHTTACYFGYFTDDIVATIRNDLMILSKKINENYSYRLMVSILQESHRSINLNIDIPSEQSDKMVQNQPLQRLLTLQLSLGTSDNWKKTRSGKIALVLVNLRYVASSVMYTIHTIYSNMQRFVRKGFPATDTLLNAKMREECILSVMGVIRWCLDYIVLLSQELMELNSAFKSNDTETIEKLVKNSIVIPLILGKIPRSFLVFSIANIRRLFSFVQKFVEKNDPNLTAKITSDNPLGAFDMVEEDYLKNDSSVIQRKFSGNGRSGSGSNSKTGKAIVIAPTFEAYYRLGSLIRRLPVSLVAFEKFLTEADTPLRNMRLDAPMSLAVEQQIVCQGYVSKNFTDAMRKISEVFNKSVLSYSNTKVSDLYFYNTSWLGLDDIVEEEDDGDDEDYEGDENNFEYDMSVVDDDNFNNHEINTAVEIKNENDIVDEDIDMESHDTESESTKVDKSPSVEKKSKRHSESIFLEKTDIKRSRRVFKKLLKKNIKDGGIIDNLRKEWLTPEEAMMGHSNAVDEAGNPRDTSSLRKCIRCGAISVIHDEVMFIPNSMAFVANPVFQHYQRICICGGSWANI